MRRILVYGSGALIVAILAGFGVVIGRSTGSASLPLPPGWSPSTGSAGSVSSAGSADSAATPGQTHATPDPRPPGPGSTFGATRSPGTALAPTSGTGSGALTARYEGTGPSGVLGLSGYTGQVTITNPGRSAVTGWEVVLSLPSGSTVTGVFGANSAQSQTSVTFNPTSATRTVPAGRSVVFTFEVAGLLANQPTGCAINGQPCA